MTYTFNLLFSLGADSRKTITLVYLINFKTEIKLDYQKRKTNY